MLNVFRQRGLSSILYAFIMVGTVLTFVIEFRPNAGKRTASLTEQCAARVRGRCITPKDFGAAYRMILSSHSGQQSRRLGLKKVALDGLVERELLIGEAGRLGISVSDDEVTDQLMSGFVRVSIPAVDPVTAQAALQEMYQGYAQMGWVTRDVAIAAIGARDPAIPVGFRDSKTKKFDLKTYERQVRNLSSRSTTEFREEQGRELLAAKMRDVVTDPVRVSESEAWDAYERQYSTAVVASVLVKESWAARWAVGRSPGDAQQWVKDNAEAFDLNLKERLAEDAPKAGHVRHILVRLAFGATAEEKATALAKLSWAAARIRGGEPFAEVARDVSEEEESARFGGEKGDKPETWVPPFKKAADALKPGEITSAAIETQFGYHLIAKDDPARAAELEAQLRRSLPASMMARARGIDAAKRIATAIAAGLRAGKTVDRAVADALEPTRHAEAVELLRVVAVPESDAGAGAALPRVEKEKGVGHSFDAMADADRPHLLTSSAFNRGGDPIQGLSTEGNASVVGFAFSGAEGDVMAEPVRAAEGFLAVQLKERHKATRDDFEKNRGALEEEMLRAKRDEALALYMRDLIDRSKDVVKIDSQYAEETHADGGVSNEDEEF